jgi:S1-C subfamily serine protease
MSPGDPVGVEGMRVQVRRVLENLGLAGVGLVLVLTVPVTGQDLIRQAAVPMILNLTDQVQGTGVIIGPRTVLSVQHVVASHLTIRLADGSMIPGSPVCVESADIGVIIAGEYFSRDIPIYPISLRTPHVDDLVTIPGYPHGVWTVKTGRIKWTTGQLIGISMSISPGNSGSPVIDATGSVVGIATRATKDLAIAAATTSIASCVRFLHLPSQ